MQEKENKEKKTFANISYVSIPYNVISDSTVKVSDDDIMSYVKKHSKLYKQEGGRAVSYVSFSADPSATDTTKSLELLTTLKIT